MLNRRALLAAGGLAAGVLGVPRLLEPEAPGHEGAASTGHVHGATSALAGRGVRQAMERFSRPMPVTPVLRPVVSIPGYDFYRVPICTTTAEIIPGVQSPVLGYGGQFVGPTIRTKTGRRTVITFINQLDEPANVHLHGGHTPPQHDGHPMDLIAPGRSRLYDYPNTQQGATLWYHDHSHQTEADHTYRGLHGAYIIEDDSEKSLRLPSGAYDVPILLRDIVLDETGRPIVYGDPANRTTILANGVPQPYFEVAARKYRFRLINSSNDRTFQLSLANARLTKISSDGGLLPAPVVLDELVLTSAERGDVVIDFSAYPIGTRLVLSDATAGPVLRFDVTGRATDNSRLPASLRPLPPLGRATVERDVDLSFNLNVPPGSLPEAVINGKTFDMNRVDFKIKHGDTEIWNVRSSDPTGFRHSFHLHLVQFRVLERNGKPPAPSEAGLKDTVLITAGEVVRVQATFRGYTGRYLYHCHFLEHSFLGMMAQMEIVR